MTRGFILLAILLFAATGCGQSGPLYLPGNPSQIRTSPPEPEERADEEEDDEDDQDADAP